MQSGMRRSARRSLFSAAKIARENGMELLGAELDPDDVQHNGAFPGEVITSKFPENDPLFKPDEDMLQRLIDSKIQPAKRFHYRYIACEHAWSAAKLMPDESEETATMLCTAGGWVKNQDPKSADRFYKALVTRCGTTARGKEAARACNGFPS